MTTTDLASVEPLTRRSGRRAAPVVSQSRDLPRVAGASELTGVSAPVLDTVISPRRAARAAREAAAAAELASGAASSGAPAAAPTSPVVAPMATRVATEAPVVESPAVSDPALSAPTSSTTGSFGGLAASIPGHVHGRRQTFVSAPAAPRRRTAPQTAAVRPAAVARTRRGSVATTARRVGLLTIVCGIVATSIIPALDATQSQAFAAGTGTGAASVASGSQQYAVSSSVTTTVGARDGYGATSVVDYEKTAISAREALGVTDYTGPSAAEYLAKPLYDHLDRAEVFQVALQYLGTPYVHGGGDPSAFDCSGLIMFVYAQFGIDLPHYVPTQDAMGTTISQSEAVPGDLVVFDNEEHDGIYAGNGMILDAPKPGGFVTVRPIWDQAHHFVRIAG
ncbi:C40 family peptidase [Frondihabitans sp. VKM Ac-2883]|uniref:C40 family peptidase n=1 Tax=Frondihabitans sp. VKM Ac-2883 TaxID=2783823 RepID=UPI00188D3590|nr:C40 family peptidase [Frondihabitans sp. VKM Ac-2883]MBF4577241.1 C40 family peptidase [Frondihabitans sp. VKM Ac-2883]